MQKVAVLVVQFVVAAAGSFISVREYGSAGCAQEDLKSDEMMTTADFLQTIGSGAQTMGECSNSTMDPTLPMSRMTSCKDGFVFFDMYHGSDSCAEAAWVLSESQNCKQEGDGWTTMACNVDGTGYAEYPRSVYSSSDCSGEPEETMVLLLKDGECMPRSELEENGNWIAQSEVYTQVDRVVTLKQFSNMDCSGTASHSTAITCGACTDVDGYYFIITCPSDPEADLTTTTADPEADLTTTTADPGVGSSDGASQPSCILPVLILLAVGAMKA